jgi:hypothetical protein
VKARFFDVLFYDIDGFSTQLAVTDPFPCEIPPYTTTHKIEFMTNVPAFFSTELSNKRKPSWFFDTAEGRPCQLSEHRTSFDADLNGGNGELTYVHKIILVLPVLQAVITRETTPELGVFGSSTQLATRPLGMS